MALKSVLDIDIDDAKFQRFRDLFTRYDEALRKQPEVWRKIGGIHQQHASQFEEMAKTLGTISQLQQRGLQDTEDQETHLRSVDRLWTSIGKSSKDFTSNVANATTSLIKWTGILGAVGGLLGAGGLWGIDRMAGRLAGDRRSAMGTGMSIGQQRAFDVNLSPLLSDPQGFLGWVAEMQQNPNQRAAYSLLGHGLTGGSSDMLTLLDAIRKFAVRTPLNMLGPMSSAYGIDMGAADLRRLKTMSEAEYQQRRGGYLRDQGRLGPPDDIAKRWVDFTLQLERATLAMRNTFEKTLAPLAGPLARLSNSFLGLLDTLVKSGVAGDAIKFLAKETDEFAHYLGSKGFRSDVQSFMDGISQMAQFAQHPLTSIMGGFNTPAQAGHEFKNTVGNADWWGLRWLFPNKDWAAKNFDTYLARLDQHEGLGAGSLELIKALENSGANARSPKGALGMFQLMPTNAQGIDPFNPVESAERAAKLLRDLVQHFGGDRESVLAGYNYGQANVDALKAKYGAGWYSHLPMETQNYVGRGMMLTIQNNTGGSATVTASGLAAGQ